MPLWIGKVVTFWKLLIPIGITLLFGMFLYYVMTNDTSTPELDKKVSNYNEKLNNAIPDWADMSLKKES